MRVAAGTGRTESSTFRSRHKGSCKDEQEHVSVEAPDLGRDGGGETGEAEGVSLNQFIASAVTEKVGVIETAGEFVEQGAVHAKPKDLLKYLRKARPERPTESDRRWQLDEIRTGIKEFHESRRVRHKDVSNWLRSWGRKRERKAPRV